MMYTVYRTKKKRNGPCLPSRECNAPRESTIDERAAHMFLRFNWLSSIGSPAAISGGGPGSVRVGSVRSLPFDPGERQRFPSENELEATD